MFCSQCKYFRKIVNLNDVSSKTGMCLRYPPKPFILPAQGQIATLAARPNVEAGDFCGEFSMRSPPKEEEKETKIVHRTKTTG